MGALSHGGAGDGGDGDRLAGDDLRYILADQAGDPTRLFASYGCHTDIGQGDWSDLHTRRELGAAFGDRSGGRWFWLVDAARLGLWRGGDGDDAGHDDPHLFRYSV